MLRERPASMSHILRERTTKQWNHAWKLSLIEAANPTWRDLAAELEP